MTVWVYNVVLSYVQNVQDAEEVVQDTLLATISGIHSFRNNSSIKTWVYSIAINKAKDYIKYKNRQKRSGNVISIDRNSENNRETIDAINFSHPGIILESKEQMEILFKAINSLPAQQKEVIILTKLEQLSMKQAAELMKTTSKAVESLLSRARQNLKMYLSEEGITIYKRKKV